MSKLQLSTYYPPNGGMNKSELFDRLEKITKVSNGYVDEIQRLRKLVDPDSFLTEREISDQADDLLDALVNAAQLEEKLAREMSDYRSQIFELIHGK